MHTKLMKAIETEALKDAGEGIRAITPRLEAVEAKLDQILALLRERQPQNHHGQQQQRGGR